MTIHTFELRRREGTPEGQVTTGANTQLLMDGAQLFGVTGLKFEMQAGSIGKLTLEIVANVKVIGQFEAAQIEIVPKTLTPAEDIDKK